MTTTPHYPIAIIGGGLGGLAAAAILHTNAIEFAVFELEANRHVRTQGGMLDIHNDTGQIALHAAGLFDAFLANIEEGGEATRILDKHATVLLNSDDDGSRGRPEIDRGTLRDLLLDSLPVDTIHWGSTVTGAHPVDGRPGRHEVELADGSRFTTDLLIGADGAWSRIRPLLSDATPAYSGISFVEADLYDADNDHPEEAEAMGGGMLFALDGDTGIMGHREPDNSLHVYLAHRADEGWIDTIDFTDRPVAQAAILELLDGWDDSLRGLIANADAPLVPRRIHALPVGHRWDRVPGVTLLGDAAHLMSPFAGEGANLAMFDAHELARAIVENPGDIEAALARYETDLFPRSEASAAETIESQEMIFAPDAPKGLLEMFEMIAKFSAEGFEGAGDPRQQALDDTASDQTPVLICGAGIAGLMAALLLHREGIPAILVEKHASTSPQPKARRLNPRSVELFRALGLSEAVQEAAAPLAAFTRVLNGTTLVDAKSVGITGMGGTAAPAADGARSPSAEGPRFADLSPVHELLCPQNVLEPVLVRAAIERGIDLRFSTRLVSFEQNDEGIVASLRGKDGEEYIVTADHLIAADGAKSPIRAALGIERTGRGHLADNLDILFRADLGAIVEGKEFNLARIDSPAASGAFVSVNGTDRWLFSTSDVDDPSGRSDDELIELLRAAIGVPDIAVEIISTMPWESGMYVAEQFSAGRVFLVGDAAHVMPPMAAAGANTAIADVANLAWKLAAVHRGRADASLLATYQSERHPTAYAVAEGSSQVVGNVGDMLSGVVAGKKMFGGDRGVTMFGAQYEAGAFVSDGRGPSPQDHFEPAGRPGTRVVHAWVSQDESTLDLVGPGLTLLAGPEGEPWIAEAERLGVRTRTVSNAEWLDAVDLPAEGALLVRADGIVAWHSSSQTSLAEAYARVLRPPVPVAPQAR
jgi:putative polyketide hydroxylase